MASSEENGPLDYETPSSGNEGSDTLNDYENDVDDPFKFWRHNIHEIDERTFRKYQYRFSRRQIERCWSGLMDIDCNEKTDRGDDGASGDFVSYWKYATHGLTKSVSEPHLNTIHVLGTDRLKVWSDSFHDLSVIPASPNRLDELYTPKITTWSYLSKRQCDDLNYAESYGDQEKLFEEAFEWWTGSTDEKRIMFRLFADLRNYCKNNNMTDEQMSSLVGNYFFAHRFAMSLNALNYEEVYDFFKALMIRHSVLAPPDHLSVFSPEEAKTILSQFLSKYLSCLPLIRHMFVPNSELHIDWQNDID